MHLVTCCQWTVSVLICIWRLLLCSPASSTWHKITSSIQLICTHQELLSSWPICSDLYAIDLITRVSFILVRVILHQQLTLESIWWVSLSPLHVFLILQTLEIPPIQSAGLHSHILLVCNITLLNSASMRSIQALCKLSRSFTSAFNCCANIANQWQNSAWLNFCPPPPLPSCHRCKIQSMFAEIWSWYHPSALLIVFYPSPTIRCHLLNIPV